MMPSDMELSVIVPVYNARPFLEECLRSVMSQLEVGDELLVHNDGSRDGSDTLLREKFPKLDVSSGVNRGVSWSRNHMAQRAKGRYLLFLDADDVLLPNAFEQIRRHMSMKDAHAGLTPISFFSDGGTSYHGRIFFENSMHVEVDPVGFFLKAIPPAASLIIPREAYLKVGGFRERMSHSEELDLVLKLCQIGVQWTFLPTVVRANREHDGVRASQNLKECCWQALTVYHRLFRGRFQLDLTPDQVQILMCAVQDHARLLYRIGEDRLGVQGLNLMDALIAKYGKIQLSKRKYDQWSRKWGYRRMEWLRKVICKVLGRNLVGYPPVRNESDLKNESEK